MTKIIITSIIVLLLSALIPIVFRVRKDIRKKLQFENTYAIQNVASGTAIRPYDAKFESGNEIIGYTLKDWECITWEMIRLEGNTYLLKNLFTEKTFQPKETPKAGIGLWQQSMGGTPLQYWEFIKQEEDTYKIRLKDTDLFITVSSNKVDAPLILMHDENTKSQKWQLVRQTPWI